MKYRVRVKNGQLEIKHRLSKGEELNNRELEILSRNNILGLARVKETSLRGIVFTAPEAVSLSSYLGGGLTREDFAFVIAQTVRIAQKINDYSLQQNNLDLSVDSVYVVKKTRELIFIYRPVISTTATSDINAFLNSVIRRTSFSTQQDTQYVEELENVLRKMEKFPSELMSNYVKRLDVKIFNLFLSDKKASAKKSSDEELTGLLDDEDELPTGLLDDEDELPTGLLDDEDELPTGLLDDEDELPTGLLDDEDELPTGLLDEGDILAASDVTGKEISGQSLLFGDDSEADLYGYYGRNFGSTVIEDDEEDIPAKANVTYAGEDRTTLYRERPSMPWLERMSNGERRNVDKPVFRIGKDKYHVDYFVDGNPAVSRNHAHIVSRNGRYFLVDNNSLNHSFVDGMIIPVQKEYEIFEGSNICLANEDFVFHTR